MYRKPGFYEVSPGLQYITWAQALYAVRQTGVTWESNLRDLFKDMSYNLGRRLRFLPLEEVLVAKSPASPLGSESQVAFAHLMSRWLTHLKVASEYPAMLRYARVPYLTIDDCVDALLAKKIIIPSWEDIGDREAKLEAVIPVFMATIRHLVALTELRSRYVSRLRAKVADLGYRIASGGQLDQFEKSFFLAFAKMTDKWGQSAYQPINKPMVVSESSDPLVEATFLALKGVVEPGPFTRFGILISNKLQQELFAFFGPYTPTYQFDYGYGSRAGQFVRLHIDETEQIAWSMEEQEDSIRMQSEALSPAVSVALTVTQPWLLYTAQSQLLRNKAEATYYPRLDVPDVLLRMADGFKSTTAEYEADWFSPTRGRQISTSRGANAEVFLQDLALMHDRFGEGQVGVSSLGNWKLYDPSSFRDNIDGLGQHLREFGASGILDYNERILYMSTESNSIQERVVDMQPFYTVRGSIMLRPAFTEYLAVHRNTLRVADTAAEAYIARSLDLSRNGRRRSEILIRLSHRWNLIKRLFSIEVMSFEELKDLARLQEGGVTITETEMKA
jgi:hypothetical protein